MSSRIVKVPPGKLGLIIDTTLEGPVVYKVNDDSPLQGSIFPGDLIVAVNDVDTRAMSSAAVTALMARTASSRRDFTVLSRDVSDGGGFIAPANISLGTVSTEEGSTVSGSTLRRDMNARIVKAPPGKLGLLIDTTVDGPMIKEVKEGKSMDTAKTTYSNLSCK